MSQFKKYSEKHSCSLEEAFADRDFPMTSDNIREEYKEITGNYPTNTQLMLCKPDSIECKRSYYNEESLD